METSTDLLEQLVLRLQSRESLDVEFKRGRGGLPHDLWPTVSAFANTRGGWILVGVQEQTDGMPFAEGLGNPDARLQDFHNQIRNPQKISTPVCGAGDATIEVIGGSQILVIRVPAASRRDRPVYVGGHPYTGTYVRRHTGDYHCTEGEVKRMMREASDDAADSAILDGYVLDDLDRDALARYRRRHQTENPGSPLTGRDDLGFLQGIGVHRRDRSTGSEGLTVAALLLFGTDEALREWRTRHLIDFRLLPDEVGRPDRWDDRWDDRVAWGGHIFGAFETIYPKLVRGLPEPFRLRGGVRQESPAHVAMREAFVNLLVHADYSETDASLILRHAEGCDFRNPGNSRVPHDDLLRGTRSEPRNPLLVSAFRYIGLADEGGTGIPKILRAWHEMGYRVPAIDAGSERYEFSIRLRHVHLIADEDRRWLALLPGVATEADHLALVQARTEGTVNNPQLCTLTGCHSTDATKTLVGLRQSGHLVADGFGRWTTYQLSDAARRAYTTESSPPQPDLFDVELAPAVDLDTTGPGLDGSDPSLDGNTPSLGGNGSTPDDKDPSLADAEVAPPASFPGSPADWDRIWAAAHTVRRTRRADRVLVDDTVWAICGIAPLSVSEMAIALGRGAAQIHQSLNRLMTEERVDYLYPGRPSSPHQRYTVPQ